MRLRVEHTTIYSYGQPVSYALQQLRLRPKDRAGQRVAEWDIAVTGGTVQLSFADEHANHVELIRVNPGSDRVELHCHGVVETADELGVMGAHGGFLPLWYFTHGTPLTRAGRGVKALARQIAAAYDPGDPLARLHALMAAVRAAVAYQTGTTGPDTSAEAALAQGSGVCQDHAQIFCAAARLLAIPARYVSGYLLMDDRTQQDATHAWAEAFVPLLGWVGFDVSNGISPDARYIRVATGLDYRDAAPVTGVHYGGLREEMHVALMVQQQ